MQQRLADLGYEITPTYEFDESTEDALRRYQVDWLYAEGTGVADEGTLAQLEYHHTNRDGGQYAEPQYIEPQFGEVQPFYDEGAGGSAQVSDDGQHWWNGEQWIPFANPTPLIDGGTMTEVENAVTETYQQVEQQAGELWDGVVDQTNKIISGEEPLPDVRN